MVFIMAEKIIIAGQGGQGVLRIGQMLAYASMHEGRTVTWLPSYGAEMRGGTANCSVIISDGIIPSPVISSPDYCLVMNKPSLIRFESWVRPGGMLIVDVSMVPDRVKRKDIRTFYISAGEIAEYEGNSRGANMVMLGAYLAASDLVMADTIFRVIDDSFTGDKAKYAKSNKALVSRGIDCFATEN